jgi:hypothetical protein
MTSRTEPAVASDSRGRPVIRATIDLISGSVRYNPWAVDDWDGERWVLEARTRTLSGGRSVRWVLEKRGGALIGCTRWLASYDELADQYGEDAAARFFPRRPDRHDQSLADVVLEIPIPIEMEPSGRRRPRRVAGGPPSTRRPLTVHH